MGNRLTKAQIVEKIRLLLDLDEAGFLQKLEKGELETLLAHVREKMDVPSFTERS